MTECYWVWYRVVTDDEFQRAFIDATSREEAKRIFWEGIPTSLLESVELGWIEQA